MRATTIAGVDPWDELFGGDLGLNVLDIRLALAGRRFGREHTRAACEWTGADFDPARSDAEIKAILRTLIAELSPGLKYRLSVRGGHYFAEQTFIVWVPAEFEGVNSLQIDLRRRTALMNKAVPVAMIGESGYMSRFAFEIGVARRECK